MRLKIALAVLGWTLLLLLALLTGCAHDSPRPKPVDAPAIPPLPVAARQPPTPAECQPTCSGALSMLLDSMQPKRTGAASPGLRASGAIGR